MTCCKDSENIPLVLGLLTWFIVGMGLQWIVGYVSKTYDQRNHWTTQQEEEKDWKIK